MGLDDNKPSMPSFAQRDGMRRRRIMFYAIAGAVLAAIVWAFWGLPPNVRQILSDLLDALYAIT